MDNPGPSAEKWVYLDPWEEIVGKLLEIDEVDGWLTVQLTSGTVVFNSDSNEARTLRENLPKYTDLTVSILRTDLEDDPIVIATESTEGAEL